MELISFFNIILSLCREFILQGVHYVTSYDLWSGLIGDDFNQSIKVSEWKPESKLELEEISSPLTNLQLLRREVRSHTSIINWKEGTNLNKRLVHEVD